MLTYLLNKTYDDEMMNYLKHTTLEMLVKRYFN